MSDGTSTATPGGGKKAPGETQGKMEKIVSLAKRRGLVFQSSEIYGGLSSCWDYGPVGVELKRNVKDAWWREMVWSRGDEIHVWSWFTIPGPFSGSLGAFTFFHTVHVWCSRVIIIGTLLHIGGVYKHAAFNQDGTFSKMLIASRE